MTKPIITTDKWSILAGVRFVLASIVAVKHLDDFTAPGLMGLISRFGTFEAIMGFLLISGYSVSNSYIKQPEGFMVRRIFRLYPVYLTAMAVTCLTFLMMNVRMPGLFILLANALLLNQLLTDHSFVGQAWSLSLEFWLYCLTPWLMGLSERRLRAAVFLSFASYLIYTVCRTLFHQPYFSGVGYGANLLYLSFLYLAGLRLARAGRGHKEALRDIGLIFVLHIALGVAIQFGYRWKHHALADFLRHDTIDYAMQSATLCFVYLVFRNLVVAERPVTGRSRFLRMLGDISYPLYLLHAVVYTALARCGFNSAGLFYLAAVAVSLAVYWLIDFYSRKHHQLVGTG